MSEAADHAPAARRPALSGLWFFFVMVFCWTWFFWILAAVLGVSVETTPGLALVLVGLLGPALGGIGFAYLTQDTAYRREYWVRVVDPRRIRAGWYLVIFLLVPVVMAVAVLLDVATNGSAALAEVGRRVSPFLAAPLTILPFVVRVFFYGPFPEELGWRGYALDRLQARWNALVSSLILGAIWTVWHLPLFWIKDTFHYDQGLWSPGFWLFVVGVVPMAVILTWIFNNSRRSTLAAILFHFVADLTYPIGNVTAGTYFYSTLLTIIVAVAVVAIWGPATLTRRPTNNQSRARSAAE